MFNFPHYDSTEFFGTSSVLYSKSLVEFLQLKRLVATMGVPVRQRTHGFGMSHKKIQKLLFYITGRRMEAEATTHLCGTQRGA